MAQVTIIKAGSSAQYVNEQNSREYTYAPNNGRDSEGHARREHFNVVLNTQAAGTYGLVTIPAGARITGISWIQSVTFGATATIALGLAGTDGSGKISGYLADAPTTDINRDEDGATGLGFFRLAATHATTTLVRFGETVALGWGFVTTKEHVLTLTVAAAALPASGSVVGYIEYTLNR